MKACDCFMHTHMHVSQNSLVQPSKLVLIIPLLVDTLKNMLTVSSSRQNQASRNMHPLHHGHIQKHKAVRTERTATSVIFE